MDKQNKQKLLNKIKNKWAINTIFKSSTSLTIREIETKLTKSALPVLVWLSISKQNKVRKMAQWEKLLAVKANNLSLIPRT